MSAYQCLDSWYSASILDIRRNVKKYSLDAVFCLIKNVFFDVPTSFVRSKVQFPSPIHDCISKRRVRLKSGGLPLGLHSTFFTSCLEDSFISHLLIFCVWDLILIFNPSCLILEKSRSSAATLENWGGPKIWMY